MKGTGAKLSVCPGSCVSTGAKFLVAPVESAPMDCCTLLYCGFVQLLLVSFASPCLVYAYGYIAIILLAHTFSFFCNVYNSILLSLNLVYAEIIRKQFL